MSQFQPSTYTANVIRGCPENFTSVQVKGVRISAKSEDGREDVGITDEDPDFYSVYVRHKDGRALVVDDFTRQEIAIEYGKELAKHYNWTFEDQAPA